MATERFRPRFMRLQEKLAIVLFLAFAVSARLNHSVFSGMSRRVLDSAAQDQAMQRSERVRSGIEYELADLLRNARAFSGEDASVLTNEWTADERLGDFALSEFALYSPEGIRLRAGRRGVSSGTVSRMGLRLPDRLEELLPDSVTEIDRWIVEPVAVGNDVLLVALGPLAPEARIRACVVRDFDRSLVVRLRQRTQELFVLYPLGSANSDAVSSNSISAAWDGEIRVPGPERSSIAAGITPESPVVVRKDHGERGFGWSVLEGVGGRRVALLGVPLSDEISMLSRIAGYHNMLALVFVSLAMLIILVVSIRFFVTRPLAVLTDRVRRASRRGNLLAPVSTPSSSEIGQLSREIQELMTRAFESQQGLMTQAYRSGVNESAVHALHSIGNLLTPVAVQADLLRDDWRRLRLERLAAALAELEQGCEDPTRRTDLWEYVTGQVNEVSDLLRKWDAQAGETKEQISKIESVMGNVSIDRDSSMLIESAAPIDVVAVALSMIPEDDRFGIGVAIDDSVSDLPAVRVERARVSSVLKVVLTNALEAVRDIGVQDKPVRVEGVRVGDWVRLSVADEGVGIAPGHLHRVFERDFTTRDRQKQPTDLHWCALVLKSQGGRIEVSSEGPGKGACFSIFLPLAASLESEAKDLRLRGAGTGSGVRGDDPA